MSKISMDVPTMKINSSDLDNLLNLIYIHEEILKQFGGIKIQLDSNCSLALKKRKVSPQRTTIQQITKISNDQFIYSVKRKEEENLSINHGSPITNEETFWNCLSTSNQKLNQSSISILSNKTFFYQKWNRKYFAIHSLPKHSLLKLGGKILTDQFLSCLSRSHGPGGIYPLSNAQQRLFSLVYHHQGGPRHWYIIPANQRESLKKIFEKENSSICIEHDELMIDPLILDKHHIRYHRVIQNPNELLVLSAGVLTQSFTEDSSWSESIDFALPSWIEEGHANQLCQCNKNQLFKTNSIDLTRFNHQLINKYRNTYLNKGQINNYIQEK